MVQACGCKEWRGDGYKNVERAHRGKNKGKAKELGRTEWRGAIKEGLREEDVEDRESWKRLLRKTNP